MCGMPHASRSISAWASATRRVPCVGGTRATVSARHQASNSGRVRPAAEATDTIESPLPRRANIAFDESFTGLAAPFRGGRGEDQDGRTTTRISARPGSATSGRGTRADHFRGDRWSRPRPGALRSARTRATLGPLREVLGSRAGSRARHPREEARHGGVSWPEVRGIRSVVLTALVVGVTRRIVRLRRNRFYGSPPSRI